MYKILIVSAECGEPQFNLLIENLKIQQGIIYKHIIISNKTTIEAESEIYNLFKIYNLNKKYNWFLRLDADMNFTSNKSIVTLINKALEFKSINRISVPLNDYYTGKQIMGVHLIRLGIILNDYHIKEFIPERWIDEIQGTSVLRLDTPLFTHGFNSDIDQCIRFGLHRGIKAVFFGPRGLHWFTLLHIQKNLNKNINDKNIWITYYSSIIGAGYLKINEITWDFVDKDSINNKYIKDIILSDFENKKIVNNFLVIYKLHYRNYFSFYETLRFILKNIIMK
jgi:hypothetical protein